MVSEPTSWALWDRGAGCLSSDGTYLLGTVGQGSRLLKQCQNLHPGHYGAGLQAVKAVSESTSQALWGRGADCLSGVGTYLLGTVGQGCRLLKRCLNLPPETLWGRGTGCLSIVGTYNVPPGQVRWGKTGYCSTFI